MLLPVLWAPSIRRGSLGLSAKGEDVLRDGVPVRQGDQAEAVPLDLHLGVVLPEDGVLRVAGVTRAAVDAVLQDGLGGVHVALGHLHEKDLAGVARHRGQVELQPGGIQGGQAGVEALDGVRPFLREEDELLLATVLLGVQDALVDGVEGDLAASGGRAAGARVVAAAAGRQGQRQGAEGQDLKKSFHVRFLLFRGDRRGGPERKTAS